MSVLNWPPGLPTAYRPFSTHDTSFNIYYLTDAEREEEFHCVKNICWLISRLMLPDISEQYRSKCIDELNAILRECCLHQAEQNLQLNYAGKRVAREIVFQMVHTYGYTHEGLNEAVLLTLQQFRELFVSLASSSFNNTHYATLLAEEAVCYAHDVHAQRDTLSSPYNSAVVPYTHFGQLVPGGLQEFRDGCMTIFPDEMIFSGHQ